MQSDLYQAFPEVRNACEGQLIGIFFIISTDLMQKCKIKCTQVGDSDDIKNILCQYQLTKLAN